MATTYRLHKHSLLFHCIHSASRRDYVPKKITCQRLYGNQTIFIISARVFCDILPEYIHAILICLRGTFVAYNKGKKGSLERCDVCGTRSNMFTAIRVWGFFSPRRSRKCLNLYGAHVSPRTIRFIDNDCSP